jgi:hypothetical protein
MKRKRNEKEGRKRKKKGSEARGCETQ